MSGDFDNELVETGFDEITVTVTEAPAPAPHVCASASGGKNCDVCFAPIGLTPEGIEALKAMVSVPADKSTPPVLMALARDVAMDIQTLPTILQKHGFSNAQFEYLATHNAFFKAALVQQANEWQRLGSTQERLKAEAAAALEEQLPVLASRMGKVSEKLGDAVEAAKLFAKIAGVDNTSSGPGATGERFTINIDLGADERITIGLNQGAPSSAAPAPGGAIPANPQGQIVKG